MYGPPPPPPRLGPRCREALLAAPRTWKSQVPRGIQQTSPPLAGHHNAQL
jgi:hypothetical protein